MARSAPSRSYKRRPRKAKKTNVAPRDMTQDALQKAYAALVDELENEAGRRVGERKDLETRWEADLRQYHGRYDTDVENRLKKERKSRLFVNITRKRTHGWEARLSDMLFPTDDKNWGISPTPMPNVSSIASDSLKKIAMYGARADRMNAMGNREGERKALEEAGPYVKQHKQAQISLKQAKDAADAMEKLILDQLVESQYAIKMRQAIHDACKVGTGVIKGPMLSTKVRRKFVKDAKTKQWVSQIVSEDPVVSWQRVNYYNFFPDMTVPTVQEGDGTFERHIVNAKELRAMQRDESLDPDAIRRILAAGADNRTPTFIQSLRDIHGTVTDTSKMFTVWEWHGVLDKEQLELMACYLDTADAKGAHQVAEMDELDELPVIIWFCQGEILKYGIHPLDSGDVLYSAFQFERDDATPFGYGVPYLMRDSQSALNGAWRMMMDHGAVSTGPQIVYDPDQLEPEDGTRRIVGNKLWRRTAPKSTTPAFEMFQVDNNQNMLARIVEMAKEFADEEAIMPMIAQGDQGTHTTQTKGGMAILMNASNVVFKRVVKNFDDFMTIPNIRRAYEFNMLHSSLEDVKGDHEVDARGSSVLLVKELQAQNLMAMALQFTAHPVLGPLTKSVDLYRRLVQAHNLPSAEIVKTNDEIQQEKQEQAGQQAPDPEQIKQDTALKLAEYERETVMMAKQEERTTAMIALAQKSNMTLDQLEAKLKIAEIQQKGKERLFTAEYAAQTRRDRLAGANGGATGKLMAAAGATKGKKPTANVAPSGGGML